MAQTREKIATRAAGVIETSSSRAAISCHNTATIAASNPRICGPKRSLPKNVPGTPDFRAGAIQRAVTPRPDRPG